MYRLEAVAGIGQRPVHDGRERILQIALFQRIAQHDLVNFRRLFRRYLSFSHGEALNPGGESGKMRISSQFRPPGRATEPPRAGAVRILSSSLRTQGPITTNG